MATYSDLITGYTGQQLVTYSDGNGGAAGNVFELFDDIGTTLGLDPSFAATIEDQLATDASAVAVLTGIFSAATLNGNKSTDTPSFISIQTDSADLDGTAGTDPDVSFVINTSIITNALTGATFSGANVVAGNINTLLSNQEIKHDVVRHLAFQITGGYAAADIFDNETALVDSVATQDSDVETQISSSLASVSGTKLFSDLQSADAAFARAAKNLYAANVNDTTRLGAIYTDFETDSYQNDTNNSANLRFNAGDVISMRINYVPFSRNPTGNNANIDDRSYRVLFPIS